MGKGIAILTFENGMRYQRKTTGFSVMINTDR